MKTFLPFRTLNLAILCICLCAISASAQTYTTVSNGSWSSASTWQGGLIPAANIPASAVINIKHIVTYSGGDITNNGTINISNPQGVSPRLIIPSGVKVSNKATGKVYITNAEYRQYRFLGGLELGLAQSGEFRNEGGTVQVTNSYVEVAKDWTNDNTGIVVFKNSSLMIGETYELKGSAIDTIDVSSISVGMHGSGDYRANGIRTVYHSARFEVASNGGKFEISGGMANGSIDYISMKNHLLNLFSTERIEVKSGVATSGLTLKAYCISDPSKYIPNGKVGGTQTRDCSLNYFPAGLMGSTSTASFNFSTTPSLVSGTVLQVGAIYKYEGVTPGVDALVKIDSLIGGATINKIDDNTGGLGFIEGFQPEIKSGSALGESYAVFTINYKVSGTDVSHTMNTFSITALDIDGNGTMKEFDQIDMGPGATAAYMVSPTNIALTEIMPGTFRAINADGNERTGIDTVGKENMFTVTNTNVSSFKLKLGMSKTNAGQSSRQFGIYMKGFVYPSLATLPVELKYFTASLDDNNNKVDLNWTTSSEKNVSHFSVEKSLDGQKFTEIGVVFAAGNSSEIINYNFADKNINTSKPGIIYYRLRSVDIDGTYEFSVVRMITIGSQNRQAISVQAYPNPVTSELRITIPASWQGKKISYELVSNNGLVAKKSVTGSANQTETINVSSLAPGFYVIMANCNGENAQQKIIKR